MVLIIVAVGDDYIENSIKHISKFVNRGWDVRILTDKPEVFKKRKVTTYQYKKKLFSYFDKFLFSMKIMEEEKCSVLYVDADWIQNIKRDFMENFKPNEEFLYYDNWPEYDNRYFSIIHDYWKMIDFDNTNLETILEWVIYFPYCEKIGKLRHDLEEMKPIFEYTSLCHNPEYIGLGNAEGLALSYVLKKNNIEIRKFNKEEFGTEPDLNKYI
jgi:hypothetical protein